MLVRINGEARELAVGATVASVVESMSAAPAGRAAPAPAGRGVAVALDGQVVPRGEWDATELSEGMRLELVVAVQGG
jgi:sulfur carrier protein